MEESHVALLHRLAFRWDGRLRMRHQRLKG